MTVERLRIGLGVDRHRFVAGRPCRLGGVEIPHDRGLLGHSDGDALLHAALDAVLGAAGLGDVGTLFPDTDATLAGADSSALVARALEGVRAQGWRVLSLDAVILADAPRVAPHRAALCKSLAALFDVPPTAVHVKGKRCESMGGEDGVECTVVALVLAPERG